MRRFSSLLLLAVVGHAASAQRAGRSASQTATSAAPLTLEGALARLAQAQRNLVQARATAQLALIRLQNAAGGPQ
ncbi:hypothetical protein [Deinococcus aestuarii]|uniref:hypothetical protein n=1 Tax=Deinococcus aestuarii TaxID=2774531 RepID=UPI001C0C0BCC|nr:hypothetical protein [Deinococcus aestuarii]